MSEFFPRITYNTLVKPDTISELLKLNKQFYQTFARQFALTRQRLQPGVRSLLPLLLDQPGLLDLGCGNGELARQLARSGYRGAYTGLDFSSELLQTAQEKLPQSFTGQFILTSLYETDWEKRLPNSEYSAILAFAVLHHLPGASSRRSFLSRLRRILTTEGLFIHSNWQFLHSERMRRRIQSWDEVALDPESVEPGDYLLDWRQGGRGLRYVHQFTVQELADLAAETGFRVRQSFYSDGKSGDLSLYQVWETAALKNATSS
jgi:tRNA (uracil-5-)-methyltransferase TRM9